MTKRDCGFTIAEVLVTLMVLSLVSTIIVTTFSGAIRDQNKVTFELQRQGQLSSVNRILTNLGLRTYDFKIEDGRIISEYRESTDLKIIGAEGNWVLSLHNKKDDEHTQLYSSKNELRFRTEGFRPRILFFEEYQNEDWIVLTSAPLRVNVTPSCDFNVVSRKCR